MGPIRKRTVAGVIFPGKNEKIQDFFTDSSISPALSSRRSSLESTTQNKSVHKKDLKTTYNKRHSTPTKEAVAKKLQQSAISHPETIENAEEWIEDHSLYTNIEDISSASLAGDLPVLKSVPARTRKVISSTRIDDPSFSGSYNNQTFSDVIISSDPSQNNAAGDTYKISKSYQTKILPGNRPISANQSRKSATGPSRNVTESVISADNRTRTVVIHEVMESETNTISTTDGYLTRTDPTVYPHSSKSDCVHQTVLPSSKEPTVVIHSIDEVPSHSCLVDENSPTRQTASVLKIVKSHRRTSPRKFISEASLPPEGNDLSNTDIFDYHNKLYPGRRSRTINEKDRSYQNTPSAKTNRTSLNTDSPASYSQSTYNLKNCPTSTSSKSMRKDGSAYNQTPNSKQQISSDVNNGKGLRKRLSASTNQMISNTEQMDNDSSPAKSPRRTSPRKKSIMSTTSASETKALGDTKDIDVRKSLRINPINDVTSNSILEPYNQIEKTPPSQKKAKRRNQDYVPENCDVVSKSSYAKRESSPKHRRTAVLSPRDELSHEIDMLSPQDNSQHRYLNQDYVPENCDVVTKSSYAKTGSSPKQRRTAVLSPQDELSHEVDMLSPQNLDSQHGYQNQEPIIDVSEGSPSSENGEEPWVFEDYTDPSHNNKKQTAAPLPEDEDSRETITSSTDDENRRDSSMSKNQFADCLMLMNCNNNGRKNSKSQKNRVNGGAELSSENQESESKVVVTKKSTKSRFSVFDPSLPSVSSSPISYGEVTKNKTPKKTRKSVVDIHGKKKVIVPEIVKPKESVTPGLRRSNRTRVTKLISRHAGDRIIYKYDPVTKCREVAGIERCSIDYLLANSCKLAEAANLRKQKRLQEKLKIPVKKKKKASENLGNQGGEIDEIDEISDEEEITYYDHDIEDSSKAVLVCPNLDVAPLYYDICGQLAEDNCDVKVCKIIQLPSLSCGSIVLGPKAVKPISLVRGYSVAFVVLKGKVLLILNEKKRILGTGSTFVVPDGNRYELKSLTDSETIVTFTTCKSSN